MPVWAIIAIAVVLSAVVGTIAFFAGVSHRRKIAEAKIGSAEKRSTCGSEGRCASNEDRSRQRNQGTPQ